MGLAASQARFLCITARKANCEYKSTDLAQQKIELTNQMADISNTYAQKMNSTTLLWDNQATTSAVNVDYNLLMSPSVANDYNPYMLSTSSGAIVLNSEYAAAAKAAGISRAGGLGSQASRDKFISALAHEGRITEESAKGITINYYPVDEAATAAKGQIVFDETRIQNVNNVAFIWNPSAGMGAEPKDKYVASDFTLSEICMSEIGQTKIDWAQVMVNSAKSTTNYITDVEFEQTKAEFDELIKSVKREEITHAVIGQLTKDYYDYEALKDNPVPGFPYDSGEAAKRKELIEIAKNINSVDTSGFILGSDGNKIEYGGSPIKRENALTAIQNQFVKDKNDFEDKYKGNKITLNDADATKFKTVINTNETKIDKVKSSISVISNGVILKGDAIEDIDIADILTGNITIISSKSGENDDEMNLTKFTNATLAIFDRVVEAFGYSNGTYVSGKGLNYDEESAKALSFAYNMIKKFYLAPGKIVNVGSASSQKSMLDNDAFKNAEAYNAIGRNNKSDSNFAISLSNMVSAFLTYYDIGLRGADSSYVVGASVDTSDYVTEDAGYIYSGKLQDDSISMAERLADFYDILYNNIIENGWREDSAINDREYLEQCIKNGTYSMTSLNALDGYYYQTIYNATGYVVEVADENAIARAEAEFMAKKAEITVKEDKIDLQTKQIDAELSALSNEYESVKNLITKSIEKTFSMFSN